MSEDRPDQWEREAREVLNGHGNWRVDREQMIAKVAAALRERGEKIAVLRRDAMFFDMARVEALEERDQLRKELEERDAQVEALGEADARWRVNVGIAVEERDAAREQLGALQHKFDVATTGPIMFPEEANRLRAQVQRLREALDALQDHHCGGMCHLDHEKVMAQVNAAMAATQEP